ncbi:polysaccharide deacetylase family protein [Candidatus Pelagibacter sp.]|nr:polysaccharide deacetylase family protein [Candidatus Pelagibacter sp.]
MIYFFKDIISSLIPINLVAKKFNPVLLYHSVGSNTKFSGGIDHVDLEILNTQLKFVQKYWTFVSIDEYASAKDKKGLACITIDDGYKNVIDEALEVFKYLNIPLTIFINSSTLEGKIFWRDKIRYLIENKMVSKYISSSNLFQKKHINKFYTVSKDQKFNSIHVEKDIDLFFLREKIILNKSDKLCFDNKKYFIKDNLISYGNHTANHYMLSSLSEQDQYDDIIKCKNFIDELNVTKSEVFSIPFGGDDSYNNTTLSILKDLNYKKILKSNNNLDAFAISNEISRFMPKNYNIEKTLKKLFLKKMIKR